MTAVTRGDQPEPLTIGVPEGYTAVTVTVGSQSMTATLAGDEVTAEWPAPVALMPGVHAVVVVVTNGPRRVTLSADPVVVEPIAPTWHTLASARRSWPNALDDHRLAELLELARFQVRQYAVEQPQDGTALLRQAQLMQARNILNAAKADPSADESGFVIQPYPLDRFVRELIRPRSAVGSVG